MQVKLLNQTKGSKEKSSTNDPTKAQVLNQRECQTTDNPMKALKYFIKQVQQATNDPN